MSGSQLPAFHVSTCRNIGWSPSIVTSTVLPSVGQHSSPPSLDDLKAGVWVKKVVLAAAHRDRDTSNNATANLAAFCQRCHMIHDRSEHQRRRWRTLFRRKALGDLFGGPYVETAPPRPNSDRP